MPTTQTALSMFRIYESGTPGEPGYIWLARYDVRGLSARVRRLNGGFWPYVSDNKWCLPASGQPLRTPELAAEAALSLARAHLDAMQRAFTPFPAEQAEEHQP